VGGVRPKLLAAERAGVRRVILPADNRADIPPDIGVEIVTVREAAEVVDAAFSRAPLEMDRSPRKPKRKTDAPQHARARNRR
jgi:ATP-dependent Lon protease